METLKHTQKFQSYLGQNGLRMVKEGYKGEDEDDAEIEKEDRNGGRDETECKRVNQPKERYSS